MWSWGNFAPGIVKGMANAMWLHWYLTNVQQEDYVLYSTCVPSANVMRFHADAQAT